MKTREIVIQSSYFYFNAIGRNVIGRSSGTAEYALVDSLSAAGDDSMRRPRRDTITVPMKKLEKGVCQPQG